MKVISNSENRSYFVKIIKKKTKNIFVQIIGIQTNKQTRIQKNSIRRRCIGVEV